MLAPSEPYSVGAGIFIVIVTPARIAQFLYDKAKLLAATRFGWLGIITVMGMYLSFSVLLTSHRSVVCVSFPPLIGHTTLATLCGFAYGMNGFYISLAGSVIGSALVFCVLRLLFSERIRAWSAQNEKWQALESVVASRMSHLLELANDRFQPLLPPFVLPRERKVFL